MHHNEEDFEIIALLYSLTGLFVWGWSIKNVSFIGRVKLGLYYIFCTEMRMPLYNKELGLQMK